MKEIIVDIGLDGEVKVETKGYKGKSCTDASKFIEEALGTVTSNKFTPEYYQKEQEKNTIKH